jgi:hypothetical protein
MSKTKLFPARESLVSDIPAGDVTKIANLYYFVKRDKHKCLSAFNKFLAPQNDTKL